ncbi:stearoyl-CoA-9-desaturase [gamma proteobacterium HTCC5015]|nr:stearoyl-CoA-9-desaturase [gamma proteobacterium HTCC5015]
MNLAEFHAAAGRSLDYLYNDFLFWSLPWWSYVLIALLCTQLTIFSVTLYLHRSQAHLALRLHPVINHCCRFWLWVTTGMVTSEWVAIHRKHHAHCETAEDPHSPVVEGFSKVMWQGAELYRDASEDESIVARYGHGTPTDWLERHLYQRKTTGVILLLLVFMALFGPAGIILWAIQMAWIPFHAAGLINGLGHHWGYRNWECPDAATNISPWGFWIGGEELHNNHHAFPSSAKFSAKPWEFDIGWVWIRCLETVGLAEVRKTLPKPIVEAGKEHLDADSVRAILRSKMHVMAAYANSVIKPVLREERERAGDAMRRQYARAKRALIRDEQRLSERQQGRLQRTLESNSTLQQVYEYRQKLQAIWAARYANNDGLLHAMQEWIQQAEASGIDALKDFAQHLKGWSLEPTPA